MIRSRFTSAVRGALALALLASAGGPAMPVWGQTQPNLNVRDAGGAIVATCAYSQGGAVFPCHVMVGVDGSGVLRVLLTDTAGHALVGVTGSVTIQGGNSIAVKTDGSGVVQPVSIAALPLPANAAQEGGGHLAAIDTATATAATNSGQLAGIATSAAAGAASAATTATNTGTVATNTANLAHESGGHLAAIDTATAAAAGSAATTATNTGTVAANTGALAGIATSAAAEAASAATTVTNTGALITNTTGLAKEGGGHLASIDTSVATVATNTAGGAKESGGHLAAIDTASATIATNTGQLAGIATSAAAEAASAATTATNTGALTTNTTGLAKEGGGHLASIDAAAASLVTASASQATAANQAATQAVPGANSARADGVQGVAGGVPVPITVPSLPLPSNAAQESGGHLAAIDTSAAHLATMDSALASTSTSAATTASNTGTVATNTANVAHESGGHLAAIDTATATIASASAGQATAANQAATQANPGANASKATAVQGVAGGVPIPVIAAPVGLSSNNNSGVIVTGGLFQTLLTINANRKGCLIQNPLTATEPLYVSVAVATASATIGKSYALPPGAHFKCSLTDVVITDNIAVMAATTNHAFTETDQ